MGMMQDYEAAQAQLEQEAYKHNMHYCRGMAFSNDRRTIIIVELNILNGKVGFSAFINHKGVISDVDLDHVFKTLQKRKELSHD